MKDKFWQLIVDFKVAERYYWHYTQRSSMQNKIITTISLLTTASSISAWWIWDNLSILWAVILALSQVLSVLKPILPFSARLSASKYIRQDIVSMLSDMESYWGTCGENLTESLAAEYYREFSIKYDNVEKRFSDDDTFPKNKKLHDTAQNEAKLIIEQYYNV